MMKHVIDLIIDNIVLVKLLNSIIITVFTFIIGLKGLSSIEDYHQRKLIDINYKNKLYLIDQKNEQLCVFTSAISKSHSLFSEFRNRFENSRYDDNFNNEKLDTLKLKFKLLEDSNLYLNEVMFKNYLLTEDLNEKSMKYRLLLSEYIVAYLRVFELLEDGFTPSEINLDSEVIKETYIFYDDIELSIEKWFDKTMELAHKEISQDISLKGELLYNERTFSKGEDAQYKRNLVRHMKKDLFQKNSSDLTILDKVSEFPYDNLSYSELKDIIRKFIVSKHKENMESLKEEIIKITYELSYDKNLDTYGQAASTVTNVLSIGLSFILGSWVKKDLIEYASIVFLMLILLFMIKQLIDKRLNKELFVGQEMAYKELKLECLKEVLLEWSNEVN